MPRSFFTSVATKGCCFCPTRASSATKGSHREDDGQSIATTTTTRATNSSSVLIVGAGRLGTWLAVKFAEAAKKASGNTPRHVVLKGSGRKSKRRGGRAGERTSRDHVRRVVRGREDGVVVTFADAQREETNRAFRLRFRTTKTYAFDSVVDEMEKLDIAKPKIAVMLHNGIVQPIFKGLGNGYVPCVIPQSYDFVEIGNGKFTIKVKNEEKPWAMPNTKEAKKVHELLTSIGANSKPDEDFEYTLLRKYFINCVANLLSIVGDCNCDGLLDTQELRSRMDVLYHEMYAALEPSHKEGFKKMPKDFYDVVFTGLRSYGGDFPSTKLDFDGSRYFRNKFVKRIRVRARSRDWETVRRTRKVSRRSQGVSEEKRCKNAWVALFDAAFLL